MATVEVKFWRELTEDENYKVKIIDIGAADMEGVSQLFMKPIGHQHPHCIRRIRSY